MSRRPPARMTRSLKVRTDGADMLMEGTGDDYGWVSNAAWQGGTLGDYDPGGSRPSWWTGSDMFNGSPIGPHGPMAGSGSGVIPWGPQGGGYGQGGYGWDQRPRNMQRGWWNTPAADGAALLAAVTRCTSLIVNPCIRTPWELDTPRGKEALPLWIRDPQLLGSVPSDLTSLVGAGHRLPEQSVWATILTHALWFGRGAFCFIEAADGQPLPGTVHIVNPYQIASQGGRWVFDPYGEDPLVTDHDGRWEMGGQTWRIMVVRGLPPNNDETPEGVLVRHFSVLRLGATIQKFSDGALTSGVPAGYLKVHTPSYGKEKAKELRDQWMQTHGDPRRSIAVLNSVVDFVPISISPVNADVVNLKRSNLIDVSHAFSMSAAFLDTGDGSLTYANISDRRREQTDSLLSFWGQTLTETLSALTPYGSDLRIRWDLFTAPNLTEQVPTIVAAVQAGVLTKDEGRLYLGLEPLTLGGTP